MALFLGGPADGWRIDVDNNSKSILIPINPHPPAFTPDKTVLNANTGPAYTYKREDIECENTKFNVYVPVSWKCEDIIEALILGYKKDKDRDRLRYVRSAEGQLYDNDDRLPVSESPEVEI